MYSLIRLFSVSGGWRLKDRKSWNCRRARIEPIGRLLPYLLTAQALAGCHDDSHRPAETGAPLPGTEAPAQDLNPPVTSPAFYPSSLEPLQGYFAGDVTIGDVDYFADALITADGLVRISVADSSRDARAEPVQFIGHVVADASQASGTGMIVGQGCTIPSSRFCSESVSAGINITLTTDDWLSGEILVEMSDGNEAWQLNMTWPEPRYTAYGYLEPATVGWAEGPYYVERAEFAVDHWDTLISIDGAGQLFFQSPNSGCVGNGTVAPHLDGAFNVYDVTLTMENCGGAYAYLNGDFEGLVTIVVSCPDEDCTLLTIYLASVEGAASRTAIKISALL